MYFQHTSRLEVVLPWPEMVLAVKDREVHIKVQALLVDLQCYNAVYTSGDSVF